MEYQPCVASGNKKAARAEAAIACLQELTTLPSYQTVELQPFGVSPVVVPSGAPRPPPCPSAPLPSKPVRPLMSLQPRPQFASLYSCRPPVSAVSSEPPPPGVDTSDFSTDVFDDFRKFESMSAQFAADQSIESDKPFASENVSVDDQHETFGIGDEGHESQFDKRPVATSGTGGLLGDAPQEVEAECGAFTDDADYDGMSAGYNERADDVQPQFVECQHIGDVPGTNSGNVENINTEFSRGPNTMFGGPCGQFYPEFEDFTEDTLLNELCGDSSRLFQQLEHWEEDFQSDACFQNPAGYGPRGMRPLRHRHLLILQSFRARGPRTPLIACPPPHIPQRFTRDPQQRFPRLFDARNPRSPMPLPRGAFRPRIRQFIRPFPRPY